MALLRLAVLIDAENISAKLYPFLVERLKSYGTIASCCAVGDFSGARLSAWVDEAKRSGIELLMQPSLGPHKNSSDIALTVRAMEIARRNYIDGICIVSNDRDFTPLALALRAQGLVVIGAGVGEIVGGMASACGSFIDLRAGLGVVVAPEPVVVAKPKPVPKAVAGKPVAAKIAVKVQAKAGLVVSAREKAVLIRMIHELCAENGGEVNPGLVGGRLRELDQALANRIGGLGKLIRNLKALGIVESVSKMANATIRPTQIASVLKTAVLAEPSRPAQIL